jgi:hypothetical protein
MSNIPAKVLPAQFDVMNQLGFELKPYLDHNGFAVWCFGGRLELTLCSDDAPEMPLIISLVEIKASQGAVRRLQTNLKDLLGIR